MRCAFLVGIVLLCGCSETIIDKLRKDEQTAKEAINILVEKGKDALPELKVALKDSDPVVRSRAKTAIGRITGQWGSETDLIWAKTFTEAKDRGKPILVLQLFGKFDEEFC